MILIITQTAFAVLHSHSSLFEFYGHILPVHKLYLLQTLFNKHPSKMILSPSFFLQCMSFKSIGSNSGKNIYCFTSPFYHKYTQFQYIYFIFIFLSYYSKSLTNNSNPVIFKLPFHTMYGYDF